MTARLTAGAARRGEQKEGGGEKVREEEGEVGEEVGEEGAGKQQSSRAAAASASQLKYVCSYFAFAFVAVVVFHVVASTEVVLFGRTRHGAARSQCLRTELPRPVQLRPAALRLAHLPAHFVVPLMKIN